MKLLDQVVSMLGKLAGLVVVAALVGGVWVMTFPLRVDARVHLGMTAAAVLEVVDEAPWKQLGFTEFQARFCSDEPAVPMCAPAPDATVYLWVVGIDTLLYVVFDATGTVIRHGIFDT